MTTSSRCIPNDTRRLHLTASTTSTSPFLYLSLIATSPTSAPSRRRDEIEEIPHKRDDPAENPPSQTRTKSNYNGGDR